MGGGEPLLEAEPFLEHAPVHNDRKARFACPPGLLDVHHVFLKPQRRCTDPNGPIHNGGHVLGAPKYVHYLHWFGHRIKVWVARLAQDILRIWVHGNDPVSPCLEKAGHYVAVPIRVRRTTDHGHSAVGLQDGEDVLVPGE